MCCGTPDTDCRRRRNGRRRRGALAGHRFPWGNTISESQANYYSDTNYTYDLNNTGYNPTYDDGVQP